MAKDMESVIAAQRIRIEREARRGEKIAERDHRKHEKKQQHLETVRTRTAPFEALFTRRHQAMQGLLTEVVTRPLNGVLGLNGSDAGICVILPESKHDNAWVKASYLNFSYHAPGYRSDPLYDQHDRNRQAAVRKLIPFIRLDIGYAAVNREHSPDRLILPSELNFKRKPTPDDEVLWLDSDAFFTVDHVRETAGTSAQKHPWMRQRLLHNDEARVVRLEETVERLVQAIQNTDLNSHLRPLVIDYPG